MYKGVGPVERDASKSTHVEALIRQLIPHAPHIGLHLAPDIPDRKLDRALRQFGRDIDRADVIALYDATRLGTGGDGVLFTAYGVSFQNSILQPVQTVRYADIVGTKTGRRLLGGRYIEIQVNRGRATIPLRIDFSARPAAAEYVARLLSDAMLVESRSPTPGTDVERVARELRKLVDRGVLTESDMKRMLDAL